MNCLKIRNALVFDNAKRGFFRGGFTVSGGRFTDLREPENGTDMDGAMIIPGLVDVHTHGRGGYDFVSATVPQMKEMKRLYAEKGVTAVVPTIASDTLDNMLSAVSRVRESGFRAVHIEGRYLNLKRRGAHREDLLAPLSSAEVALFRERAGNMRLHFTAAFELDADGSFLDAIRSRGATAGLGHTDADYGTAMKLAENGVRSFTHLFNAMPPVHHRAGGAAAAGLLSDAYTELICDGFHVSPEMISLAGRVKSPERVVLITDSMEGTGCPDGDYSIAGNPVILRGGRAYTADGAIAGSTLDLIDGVRNYSEFRNIPFAGAVPCATSNPADMIGFSDTGRIEPGFRADFVVLNPDFSVREVYISGNRI